MSPSPASTVQLAHRHFLQAQNTPAQLSDILFPNLCPCPGHPSTPAHQAEVPCVAAEDAEPLPHQDPPVRNQNRALRKTEAPHFDAAFTVQEHCGSSDLIINLISLRHRAPSGWGRAVYGHFSDRKLSRKQESKITCLRPFSKSAAEPTSVWVGWGCTWLVSHSQDAGPTFCLQLPWL